MLLLFCFILVFFFFSQILCENLLMGQWFVFILEQCIWRFPCRMPFLPLPFVLTVTISPQYSATTTLSFAFFFCLHKKIENSKSSVIVSEISCYWSLIWMQSFHCQCQINMIKTCFHNFLLTKEKNITQFVVDFFSSSSSFHSSDIEHMFFYDDV